MAGGVPVPVQQATPSERKGESSPDELTADEVYDLLSNQRRRFVLYHLANAGETSLRDLSRLVAAWENDVDEEAVTSVQRKRVYTALHQTHLMRLDSHDVIEYDQSRGTVAPTERLAVFEPFLETGDTGSYPWDRYYAGLGAVAGAVAIGALVDVPIVASLDAALVALALSGAVVAMAWAQATSGSDREMPGTLSGLTPEFRAESDE